MLVKTDRCCRKAVMKIGFREITKRPLYLVFRFVGKLHAIASFLLWLRLWFKGDRSHLTEKKQCHCQNVEPENQALPQHTTFLFKQRPDHVKIPPFPASDTDRRPPLVARRP